MTRAWPVQRASVSRMLWYGWVWTVAFAVLRAACGQDLPVADSPAGPAVAPSWASEPKTHACVRDHSIEQRLAALEASLLHDPHPSPAPDPVALEQEVDELRARLDALEKSQAADRTRKKASGEWVDVSDEKWTVKLGGHVQLDYVVWPYADPSIDGAQNYFSYRRLRLVADGTGYGMYDFRLQMTLEPGQGSADDITASADVKDAYFTIHDVPRLGRIRIGNFFVPFSLEQVTNDTNNIFHERSIPTQGIFSADREVGVALYNCTPDLDVTWTTGIFFDDINDTNKARIDNNQGYRLSGRLTWLPYYDEPSGGRYLIYSGIGVLHTDDQNDSLRLRARPQIQRGPVLIDSGSLPADTYTTGNLEGAVVLGPVTVQTEAFLSTVHLTTGERALADGAYVHLSYFLTGENRVFERFGQHGAQFGRNRPFTNFFITPGGIGWGAWEFKTRWSRLSLTEFDRGQYNDLTTGFNWYWSDRTRWMFDWVHPITSSQTVFGDTESDLFAMRFDFNW